MRAHTQQGDPSLTFDWHHDPPEEVRAVLQNILYKALSVPSSCSTSFLAISRLGTCPYAELAAGKVGARGDPTPAPPVRPNAHETATLR